MIPKKQPKFILTQRSKSPADTAWYDIACKDRHVPFIHVDIRGRLANIWWELRWLGLHGSEFPSHKLTPLGIQLHQLFDRCNIGRSQSSVCGDAGYFIDIPHEDATKVAEELFDIFIINLKEKADQEEAASRFAVD